MFRILKRMFKGGSGSIMINNQVGGDCAGRNLYVNQSKVKSSNEDIIGVVFEGDVLKLNGENITIKNGNITVNGKQINHKKQLIKKIEINGVVKTLEVDNCDTVSAKNVGTLKTVSGDVYCDNVSGNVSTISGDVSCKSISGKVSTVSGDVN